MSRPKKIKLLSTGDLADRQRSVLASLPGYWSITTGPSADAVYVDSDISAANAAVGLGARYVMIGKPGALSAKAIASLDQRAKIVVASEILPRLWVDGSLEGTREWPLIRAITTVGSEDDFGSALFDQLAAVRMMAGSLDEAVTLVRDAGTYLVRARAVQGAAIALSGVVTKLPGRSVSIDAIAIDRRVEIDVDLGPIASPARVAVWSDTGMAQRMPVHQSGLRILWQELARESPLAARLSPLAVAEDIAEARRLLGLDAA